MSHIVTTLYRYKTKDTPLTLTLGDEQVQIHIDWAKTTNKQVYFIINADRKIDVLIPATFSKLKEKILDLELRLKAVCNE